MSIVPSIAHRDLMAGLQVVHLQFNVTAIDTIGFGRQAGSDLRGALYGIMGRSFCGATPRERTQAHVQTCPVCRLLAAEDIGGRRGKDIPRPLTLEPPLMASPIAAGDAFTFGVSLIGWAEQALLYVIRAVELAGRSGVGQGRGRYRLDSVFESSPLSGARQELLVDRKVLRPTLKVDAPAIDGVLQTGETTRVMLELLTPMRLTRAGKPVTEADPVALIQRLLERCQGLVENHGDDGDSRQAECDAWRDLHGVLGEVADRVVVESHDIHWVDARSGSRTKNGYSSISGLAGKMVWTGELTPLLPWIFWGQSLHVGKNAVKGNGWYRVWR